MTGADHEFVRALLKARSGLHLSVERQYLAETAPSFVRCYLNCAIDSAGALVGVMSSEHRD